VQFGFGFGVEKCWARALALAWTNLSGEKETRRACEVEEIGRRGI
jgi:hypothetical protein